MKIKNKIFIGVGLLFLIIVSTYLFSKNKNTQFIEENNEEKALLEQILVEINSENFSVSRCEDLQTIEAKQICYRAHVIQRIVRNQLIERDICYKLLEGREQDICLFESAKIRNN